MRLIIIFPVPNTSHSPTANSLHIHSNSHAHKRNNYMTEENKHMQAAPQLNVMDTVVSSSGCDVLVSGDELVL